MFKRILSVLGLILVAAIATLALAPFLVSPQAIASTVEARLEAWTGRKVTLAGSVSLSVFPQIVARIDDVTIANAPGMGEEPMARMAAVDAEVRLLPLLSGRIEVARFTLVEPQINLEVGKDGRKNWAFGNAASTAPATGGAAGAGGAMTSSARIEFAGLGVLRIERGALRYRAANGAVHALANIDAQVDWPRVADPLSLTSTFDVAGIPVALNASVAEPAALAGGGNSAVSLVLNGAGAASTFQGSLNLATEATGEGTLEMSAASLRNLAALAGIAAPLQHGLEAFALKSKLSIGARKLSLTEANLQLDGNGGDGAIVIKLGGEKPAIQATLAFANLNLNPYVAAPGANGQAGVATQQAGAAPAPQTQATGSWSNSPIDLSGLAAIDADLRISATRLELRDMPLGGVALTLSLAGGQLMAEVGDLQGYGGHLAGTLNVHSKRKVPAIALALTARDVALQPFLGDLTGFRRVSAAGAVDLSVKGVGRSQAEIMSSLAGTAKLQTGPGTIEGIDLASLAGLLQTRTLDGWQSAGGNATPFDSVQASFNIADGIAQNNDLALRGPSLSLNGAGIIDLPARTLDYRVETALASGLNVAPGAAQPVFTIPVFVRGPWERPSIALDPAGLIQNAPAIEETVKNVKDALKSGDLQAVEDQVKKSGLKSLFDNLTGRKKN